ncbi:hypothetical protein, partial [Dyadobacter sp.]|uniref:hypothetical protein n=1 Tax=Dyadobacter sp. TaxID=1914288 RepID=UPI003F730756
NDFEKFEKVDSQSVYLKYLETDGYIFVGNRKETFILDRTALHVAAKCSAPANSPVYDRKMYYKKNNSIYKLDISTFLNKKLAGSY